MRIVVGNDEVDDEPAFEPLARRLDDGDRRSDFGARGHQRRPVDVSPAVILRVRDFEAPRPDVDREINKSRDILDVGPVDHRVDRQGQAQHRDPRGEGPLPVVGAGQAGDPVGPAGLGRLERELHMVEPRLRQGVERVARGSDSGRDEVRIEALARAMGREFDDIGPRRRFAAGEVNVQNPERGSLAEHALPGFGVKLADRRSSSSGLEQ